VKPFALVAAFLFAVAVRAADTPPPKSEAPPTKSEEAPAASKHRLAGSFKGHAVSESPATTQSKPAIKAAPPPAGKKKKTLVIDNAMVKGAGTEGEHGAPPKASSPEASPPAATMPAAAMPTILDLQGHDEAYWRAKATATREGVQKAEEAFAAAEAEEKREENDFYSWDDGQYRDNVIKPAWDRAKEETIRTKAALETAQKLLDDLEDEARRAGAYPGWIR
jgi:hypothetical protein